MDQTLYGRKWKLKVLCTDGSLFEVGAEGLGDESLRCLFSIDYPGLQGYYFSEFIIYNTEQETERKIISEGAQVFFYAGYENGLYGQIFGGYIFQSMYQRENVVDSKLILRCIDGDRIFDNNHVSLSLPSGYKEVTLINSIAAKSRVQIPIGGISSSIVSDSQEMPRGCVVFDAPSRKLREITRNNSAMMYVTNGKLNIGKPTDDYIIMVDVNPNTGLIGTPQQIDYGVSFRTLLNPYLVMDYPPRVVKLDMSGVHIQQQTAQPGKDLVAQLPKDGLFKIGGVKHTGDTRGNEWYTDVIGYSATGKMGIQLATATGLGNRMIVDPFKIDTT